MSLLSLAETGGRAKRLSQHLAAVCWQLCVVEKWRDIQEAFSLSTPEHFHCAKLLVGTCIGLGIRVFVPVSTRNRT